MKVTSSKGLEYDGLDALRRAKVITAAGDCITDIAADRIEELEAAISTTVEDLCLRAEKATDSDVAQMLWGIAEDLEKAALEQGESQA